MVNGGATIGATFTLCVSASAQALYYRALPREAAPPVCRRSATRHPWNSLLFLLPLLAAYEGGILWLGGTVASKTSN